MSVWIRVWLSFCICRMRSTWIRRVLLRQTALEWWIRSPPETWGAPQGVTWGESPTHPGPNLRLNVHLQQTERIQNQSSTITFPGSSTIPHKVLSMPARRHRTDMPRCTPTSAPVVARTPFHTLFQPTTGIKHPLTSLMPSCSRSTTSNRCWETTAWTCQWVSPALPAITVRKAVGIRWVPACHTAKWWPRAPVASRPALVWIPACTMPTVRAPLPIATVESKSSLFLLLLSNADTDVVICSRHAMVTHWVETHRQPSSSHHHHLTKPDMNLSVTTASSDPATSLSHSGLPQSIPGLNPANSSSSSRRMAASRSSTSASAMAAGRNRWASVSPGPLNSRLSTAPSSNTLACNHQQLSVLLVCIHSLNNPTPCYWFYYGVYSKYPRNAWGIEKLHKLAFGKRLLCTDELYDFYIFFFFKTWLKHFFNKSCFYNPDAATFGFEASLCLHSEVDNFLQ